MFSQRFFNSFTQSPFLYLLDEQFLLHEQTGKFYRSKLLVEIGHHWNHWSVYANQQSYHFA